ncbi:MAG: hypothetical protein JW767_00095 [Thermoleophilia bacterium]|nr:hypothetical protein [Thermoleophilia bacterium]
MSRSLSATRRRLTLVVLVLASTAALIAVAWRPAVDDGAAARDRSPDPAPTEPSPTATAPAAAETAAAETSAAGELIVPNDRTVKADLLEQLEPSPEVLIFGGSRATRFEPTYLERLTGLRGFNAALQNGRPEDAWAFVNWVHRDRPETRPRVLWFIHVEAFRAQGLSVGLIQDERLSPFFPDALIARERNKLPRTEAEMPAGRDLALTTYGPDGVVLRNRYDIRAEKGYKLERALAWSVDRALERYATTTPALDPRSTTYFEKTIRLLNEQGTTPAIVLMPLHPTLLAAVRDAGWETRHLEVLDYLHDLQEEYDLVVLDHSRLRSIDGDPDGYYDGFHVKRANARRLLDIVVEEAPACFE